MCIHYPLVANGLESRHICDTLFVLGHLFGNRPPGYGQRAKLPLGFPENVNPYRGVGMKLHRLLMTMDIALATHDDRKSHEQVQDIVFDTMLRVFAVKTDENSWLTTVAMPKKMEELLDVVATHFEAPLQFRKAEVSKWVMEAYERKQSEYLAERVGNLCEELQLSEEKVMELRSVVQEKENQVSEGRTSRTKKKKLKKQIRTLRAENDSLRRIRSREVHFRA
jgi:hypothetical protein